MFAMCCSQYGQAEERNDVYYSSIVGQPSDGTKEQGAPQSLMPYPNGAYWNAGGDDLYHLASGLTSSFEPLPTDVELFTSQAGLQYSESDDGYARRTNDETLVGELPLDMIEPSVDLPGDQAVHMTQTELLLMMGCPETILQVGNSAVTTTAAFEDPGSHYISPNTAPGGSQLPQATEIPNFGPIGYTLPSIDHRQYTFPPSACQDHIRGKQITEDGPDEWSASILEAPFYEVYPSSNDVQGLVVQNVANLQHVGLDPFYELNRPSSAAVQLQYPEIDETMPLASDMSMATATRSMSHSAVGLGQRRAIYSPRTGRSIDLPPVKLPENVSTIKKRGKRGRITACLFCRRRKIQCRGPIPGKSDKTCIQCERRKQPCEYPQGRPRGAQI